MSALFPLGLFVVSELPGFPPDASRYRAAPELGQLYVPGGMLNDPLLVEIVVASEVAGLP
jgi:hypothetical protein